MNQLFAQGFPKVWLKFESPCKEGMHNFSTPTHAKPSLKNKTFFFISHKDTMCTMCTMYHVYYVYDVGLSGGGGEVDFLVTPRAFRHGLSHAHTGAPCVSE